MLVAITYLLPVLATMSLVSLMAPKKKAKAKPTTTEKRKKKPSSKKGEEIADDDDDDAEEKRRAAHEKTSGLNGFAFFVGMWFVKQDNNTSF